MTISKNLKRSIALVLIFAALSVVGLFFTASADEVVPETCSVCGTDYVNGFCDCEGEASYQPIVQNAEGVYEIGNAGQLYSFAKMINDLELTYTDPITVNARITADITVNERVTENGELIADTSSLRKWVPIGTMDQNDDWNALEVNLDGAGHVISGLYREVLGHGEASGLFGELYKGSITRLGIVDSAFNAPNVFHVGTFVGNAVYVTVKDCFSTATVIGDYNYYSGGIIGDGDDPTVIENCYFGGKIVGGSATGGNAIVCDYYFEEAVLNCYYIDTAGVGSLLAESVSGEQVSSGYLTYRLNGGVTDGTQTWYQTVGEGSPAFAGETVYASVPCPAFFANSANEVITHGHVYNADAGYNELCHWDGVCEGCGTKANESEHNIRELYNSCECGFVPEFMAEDADGAVTYYVNENTYSLPSGTRLTLLKSVELSKSISIYSDGEVIFDLNGYTLKTDMHVYCDLTIIDSDYEKRGVLDVGVYVYDDDSCLIDGVRVGANGSLYAFSDSSQVEGQVTVRGTIFEGSRVLHPSVVDGGIKIISAEFVNGVELFDTSEHTLNGLLVDGGYYTDESGERLELTEGQSVIEGRVFIKTPAVTVTVDGATEYYSDLAEALASIGEGESAVITLIRDADYVTEAILDVKRGDVTLDLAGHSISNVVIAIRDAELTICDSSEDESGSFTQPNGVTGFMVEEGAIGLTILSGNFDTAISTYAPLVIDGGRFVTLWIGIDSEDGTVTVNNGELGNTVINLGMALPGAVTLNGGSGVSLDIGNGTLADVLGENRYLMLEDGNLVTDFAESYIVSPFTVVEHTHEITLNYHDTHHWLGCACGVVEGEVEEHSGGTATCESGAFCETCGVEYIPALGHSWDEGVETLAPDCESYGEVTYTCGNDPGHTKTEQISPIGHAWDEGVVTKESTCTEHGTVLYTCGNDATHTKTENKALTEHNYEDFVCTECGGSALIAIILNRSYVIYTNDIGDVAFCADYYNYKEMNVVLNGAVVVPAGDEITVEFTRGINTIDLAGHTLYGVYFAVTNSAIVIEDSSDEGDGVITFDGTGVVIAAGGASSSVTVNGGCVQGIITTVPTDEESRTRITLSGGSHELLVMGGGMELEITGGEYTDLAILASRMEGVADSKFLIQGGRFTNVTVDGSYDGVKLSDIFSDASCIVYTVEDGSPEIDLTDVSYEGTFTVSHDDSHIDTTKYYYDETLHWNACENGVRLGVGAHVYGEDATCITCSAPAPYVVNINGDLYSFQSFAEAIDFALPYDYATLTLNRDAGFKNTDASTLELYASGMFTIDLNGYTLSMGVTISVQNGAIVITDTSDEGGGTISVSHLYVSGGSLELSNVRLTHRDHVNAAEVSVRGALLLNGAVFEKAFRFFGDGSPPIFIDVTFEEGIETSFEYSLEYLLGAECLIVTDGNGKVPVFEDESLYEGKLTIKHKGDCFTSDWHNAGDGKHSTVCIYCGIAGKTEDCYGGEATCDSGAVCEACNTVYGTPLGHELEGELCTVCGERAPIIVSAGGETEYFFSMVDAFLYADGFDIATVMLRGNVVLLEEAEIEIERVELILDLNGYSLEIREMNIYGGSVTVTDSSAVKRGYFYSDSTLDVYNGSLILEEGNFGDLWIDLDPEEDGYSATVDIRGGSFGELNIETDYEGEMFIIISGGVIDMLYLEIDEPTTVSVSGGELYGIYTDNGSYLYYITDILNVDDCLKAIDANGRRIYFDEYEVEYYGYIRFIHDPASDAESKLYTSGHYHWYECECGIVSELESHRGGTATCDEYAVCEVCLETYGDLTPHTYDGFVCTACEYVTAGDVRVDIGKYTEYFNTVSEAIEFAAKYGEFAKITLQNDVEEANINAYYCDLIIDINGYAWLFDYLSVGDADVVITDSSETSENTLNSGGIILVYEGSLEITGGRFGSLLIALSNEYTGAYVEISGGSFESVVVDHYKLDLITYGYVSADLDVTGGDFEELIINLGDYVNASMTGGTVSGLLAISSRTGEEADLSVLLPYDCYSFTDEDGTALSLADATEHEGYLAVTHIATYEMKHEGDTHYGECICGERSETLTDIYDNACDATCSACDYVREVGDHLYDNSCDATCNECGATRDGAGHKYDNDCDAICNDCAAERAVADHVYDNACDASCNVCSALRVASGHVYGDVTVTVEPTHSECGKGSVVCEVCGATDEVVIPEQSGLSGGAVAAISVGSTVTVGAGSFSLLWFVIRKKKWIDLVTAFRA